MEQNKEAEQAWKQKAGNFQSFRSSIKYACIDNYLQGISDYRESLREAIEKEIDAMPDFQSRDRGDYAYISGLQKALQLLDTVKPNP